MAAWWGQFVGIPYADRGSSFSGCHCYGLGQLMYRLAHQIELPECTVSAADAFARINAFKEGLAVGPWREAGKTLQALDGVLMRRRVTVDGRARDVEDHCGWMVTPEIMIHVEQGAYTHWVEIADPHIERRIVRFMRHERLM